MITPSTAVKEKWLGYKNSNGVLTPGKQQFFKLEVYTLSNSSYVLSNTFSSNKDIVDTINIKTLDVLLSSIIITKSICQDSDFSVNGKVTSASMSFTAIKNGVVDSVLKSLSGSYYIKVYMSADDDEAFMGFFEVSTRSVDSNSAYYVFSDFLDRLDKVYYVFSNGITASTHFSAIWAKVYSETGCEFFNTLCPASWGNQSDASTIIPVRSDFYNTTNGYQCSCRDALKYLGEFTGKTFIITEDINTRAFGCWPMLSNGHVEFTTYVYSHAIIKDLVYQENSITIGKYRFYYSETGFIDKNYVNPSYTLIFKNNPLIGNATAALTVSNKYNRSTSTLPGELDVLNYAYVEPMSLARWGKKIPYKGYSYVTRVVYKLNGVMQIFFAGPKDVKNIIDIPTDIKDFRYTIPGTVSQAAGAGKLSSSGVLTITLPTEFSNGLSSAAYVVMVTPKSSATLYVDSESTTQFKVHGPAYTNFYWFAVKT